MDSLSEGLRMSGFADRQAFEVPTASDQKRSVELPPATAVMQRMLPFTIYDIRA